MKLIYSLGISSALLFSATATAETPVATDILIGQASDVEVDQESEQIIKTLQRKTFLKLKRWELSPHIAFVSNDPFLNRYIFGAGFAYNLTEVFSVEAMVDYSPDLGDADWKPLTKQLVEKNSVSPDISKIGAFGSFCFLFSPIYGKAAVVGRNIVNFDIYGKFGMGMTQTVDDLSALQAEEDERAQSTQVQFHPTTNFGAGAKIIFNQNIAARAEARSMIYIETVNGTTLEMKNNLLIQFSASFFFPTIKS
jgi:outer membrane beta-barrel protein